MSQIYEIVLLMLALGVAIFAGSELWRESRRRHAEREHLDRMAGDATGGDDTRAEERRPGRLGRRLRAAGLALPAWAFVAAVLVAAAAFGLMVWAVLPQIAIAGVLAAILAAWVPFSMIEASAYRRARKFLEKLVDAVDVMCAALDGGEPPPNALATAAAAAEPPAKAELRESYQRIQIGFSVRRSFARMVERYDSEGVRLITQTLVVKWQAGGDLSPVLRSVNQVARERLRQDRELRTHLAGAQASAVMTALLPYLLLPVFVWKRPDWFRDLTGSALGLQLLTAAVLLQFVGFLWLRRLMRVQQ